VNWQNASSETGTIATGNPAYVGRFAPSPTGPLHFGSLLAAVASYLEARSNNGHWLLRIEDIDPPREQPGATEMILAGLEAYGFEWDGPTSFQSASRDAHEAAIKRLIDTGQAYRCGCSRRRLASAPQGSLGSIYPGTCRDGCDSDETALRVRTDDEEIVFIDALQGHQSQRLESESGDFIILRRDGLVAYQLAVVVDDEMQGITDIVRGIDLLDSTPRQIWLQQLLGFKTPNYCHIPVAINADGQKLSKNTGARGLSLNNIEATLVAALKALGQNPTPELARADIPEIWQWADAHWDITVLKLETTLPLESATGVLA
jgi:glutamyl-Q tRNA(Asp) synthetase